METKRLLLIAFIVAIVLLIPLIGMQFSDQVNWTLYDFIIGGALLFGLGLLLDFVGRRSRNYKYRKPLLILIVLFFILIWAELAVGIFGTPLAGS